MNKIKYLLFMLLPTIMLVSPVHAVSNSYWGYNVKSPTNDYFYDCTSSSSCSTALATYGATGFNSDLTSQYPIYMTPSANTISGSYGIMNIFNPESMLLSGKLYNLSVYTCADSSYNTAINLYSGSNISQVTSKSYITKNKSFTSLEVSNQPFAEYRYGDTGDTSFNSCRQFNWVFEPQVDSNYLGVQYTTATTVTARQWFIGYQIELLGNSSELSESDIQTIIDNSNTTINNNINEMEESINGTINDNFNSCHTSENLFDMKNLSVSNATITYGEDSFTIVSTGTWGMATYSIYLPVGTYTIGGYMSGTYPFIDIYNSSGYVGGGAFPQTFNSSGDTFTFRFYGSTTDTTGTTNFDKIQLVKGGTIGSYEPYGEICENKIDATNDKLDDLNSSINNSNVSSNEYENFFSGFQTDTFGLTSIITAPLEFIGSITSSSCIPLGIPLPYVDENLTLPCFSEIYTRYFGDFFKLYQTITFGIVSYWVCVRIFNLVKDFKNPDHDEIEVMDL